jgi:hypothetical protein
VCGGCGRAAPAFSREAALVIVGELTSQLIELSNRIAGATETGAEVLLGTLSRERIRALTNLDRYLHGLSDRRLAAPQAGSAGLDDLGLFAALARLSFTIMDIPEAVWAQSSATDPHSPSALTWVALHMTLHDLEDVALALRLPAVTDVDRPVNVSAARHTTRSGSRLRRKGHSRRPAALQPA